MAFEFSKAIQSPFFGILFWIGILIAFAFLIVGWTIIFNFGTLMKVGFFILGLFVAKKVLLDRRS